MDADFWPPKTQSTRHLPAHLSSGNRFVLDDSQVNDDVKSFTACPFCYVDIELCKLCDHLEGEHCFDVTNSVCPHCAQNLGRDVPGHFWTYHPCSIKTHRRGQKSGFWNFYAGRMMGNSSVKTNAENLNALAPDPLLSSFFFSKPNPETKNDHSENSCSFDDLSSISETKSSKSSTFAPRQTKEDSEELRQRAEFCRQLFFSTIV
ncbi:protein DEHYDRATION-INDUCED 19 homolog 5-like [Amaranthus tricolor]|uniref:protein DEHYDRATION-INDUCED 19 homolog 5-like n=1 Tax=Amaranthus tricolor TaxID=29722 RepID=UPI00258857C5|nr:protein DEHYDRATION-INDUCED 19 homolog 5-like [Amaranthus tricolor]